MGDVRPGLFGSWEGLEEIKWERREMEVPTT